MNSSNRQVGFLDQGETGSLHFFRKDEKIPLCKIHVLVEYAKTKPSQNVFALENYKHYYRIIYGTVVQVRLK